MEAMQRSTLSTYALSTVLMAASAMGASAATASPRWEPPKIERKPVFGKPFEYAIAVTNIAIAAPVGNTAFVSPKDRTLQVLRSYHPENPKGDSSITTNPEHIALAERIVNSLPAGYPIPWANRNDDGEVGLYWDDNDAYADIDIDAEGSISFFSKLRSTGEEDFVSDIDIFDLNRDWANKHLSLLLRKMPRAA
jgi:hypothetical protein